MRIWDVNPGYLARQQLLGEHRELHGLFNILHLGKRGYANHPETRRWVGHLAALRCRHDLLVEELLLRGYHHQSPLEPRTDDTIIDGFFPLIWPSTWIDAPHRQFALLAGKYADGRRGRIPLPINPQTLWAQHKYSVLARNPTLYAQIGPAVANGVYRKDFASLAWKLTEVMRQPPESRYLANALQHMWGHVSNQSQSAPPEEPAALLAVIRHEAELQHEPYLMASTALGELGAYL